MTQKELTRRERQITNRLIKAGWTNHKGFLAKDNFMFSLTGDPDEYEGGATLSLHDRPWQDGDNETHTNPSCDHHKLWIDYPAPVRELIGEMSIELVMLQIDRAIASSELEFSAL